MPIKDNSIFFETVTRRQLRRPFRILIWVIGVGILLMTLSLSSTILTHYIIADEEPIPTAIPLISENWTGQIEFYESTRRASDSLQSEYIAAIIFEPFMSSERKRKVYALNAWAAGLDTTSLRWIVVPWKEPKTAMTAKTVVDSLIQWNASKAVVLTAEMHSARSLSLYRFATFSAEINAKESVNEKGKSPEFYVLLQHDSLVNRMNWTKTGTGISIVFSETLKKVVYDLFWIP